MAAGLPKEDKAWAFYIEGQAGTACREGTTPLPGFTGDQGPQMFGVPDGW